MPPFVGRHAELAQLHPWLGDPSVRLIALTGPGGVGKSRLAHQALGGQAQMFADGVYAVDMTAVAEPALALDAIAHAVGVPETPGTQRAVQLAAWMRSRHALLLLDNSDQLADADGLIGDLLGAAPHLTILITRRMPLRHHAAYELRVAPLPVPPPGAQPTPDDLHTWDALQFLVNVMRAADPAFTPRAADLPALAALVQRLDGIPLALELAASQVRLLGPRAILERLEQRPAAGTAAPASDRFEALDAAMAWSYANLDPAAQGLLRHLTVFVGGASLAAIQAVCLPPAHQPDGVLDALGTLMERNLARQLGADAGGPRVGLLETIRRFGREQAVVQGEVRLLQRRHADYFGALAKQAAAHLGGPEHTAALDLLEQEHGNLRAALAWGMQPDGDALTALHLGALLTRFWAVRGHLREGRAWLDQILRDTAAPPAFAAAQPLAFRTARAQAVLAAAQLAHHQRDQSASSTLFGEALALCRELDLPEGEAHALRGLGNNAVEAGRFAEARARYEASLALAERLELTAQIGSLLNNLGLVALYESNYARATELMQRCLGVYKRLGDTDRMSALLSNLGLVALRAGEPAAAARYLGESLRLTIGLHDAWGVAHTLGRIAELALAMHQSEPAAWLLGAAEQYPGYSTMLDKADHAAYINLLAALDHALGAPTRAVHQDAGRSAPSTAALERAQSLCEAGRTGAL